MRYPVMNLYGSGPRRRPPFLGQSRCDQISGLLDRYNCQNEELKDKLSRLSTPYMQPGPNIVAPPPPEPDTREVRVFPPPTTTAAAPGRPFEPAGPEVPAGVATGGFSATGQPPELPPYEPPPPVACGPNETPNPAPPPACLPNVPTEVKPWTPPPRPYGPIYPPSVATGGFAGEPATTPPPPPPPPSQPGARACYSCPDGRGGTMNVMRTSVEAAGQRCTPTNEVNCRPPVVSEDRYIPGGVTSPIGLVPFGEGATIAPSMFADGGMTSAASFGLTGRRFPVMNLARGRSK